MRGTATPDGPWLSRPTAVGWYKIRYLVKGSRRPRYDVEFWGMDGWAFPLADGPTLAKPREFNGPFKDEPEI